MGWMVRAVEGLVIVWWRRLVRRAAPSPPRAYPARVASLARAPFAERKGRLAFVHPVHPHPSPLPSGERGLLLVNQRFIRPRRYVVGV